MKELMLEKEITVKASAEDVWRAWTTVVGVRRFFAPDARLDIRPGGIYEILFDPDAPPGKQGSEGCKVLGFVPGKMLSFTWNAPPQYANARKQLAQWVVIFLDPEGKKRTRVRFFELGWKQGK
ncbi:MAG TPA: SRPBCC domain-containing protein, partial [Nitrososphaerales archaeon]|nr:SRPBCC domain-containing protein [Nitrososphaerales archaeon]